NFPFGSGGFSLGHLYILAAPITSHTTRPAPMAATVRIIAHHSKHRPLYRRGQHPSGYSPAVSAYLCNFAGPDYLGFGGACPYAHRFLAHAAVFIWSISKSRCAAFA